MDVISPALRLGAFEPRPAGRLECTYDRVAGTNPGSSRWPLPMDRLRRTIALVHRRRSASRSFWSRKEFETSSPAMGSLVSSRILPRRNLRLICLMPAIYGHGDLLCFSGKQIASRHGPSAAFSPIRLRRERWSPNSLTPEPASRATTC